VVSARSAYGQRMVSVWSAYGQRMVSVWSAYGQRMVSVWSAYGQHMIGSGAMTDDHDRSASKAFASLPATGKGRSGG